MQDHKYYYILFLIYKYNMSQFLNNVNLKLNLLDLNTSKKVETNYTAKKFPIKIIIYKNLDYQIRDSIIKYSYNYITF